MKKSVVIFLSLVIITFVLSIVHVVVANVLSTTGVELDAIQTDLLKYKKENVILRESVLENASLYQIASKAAELGFVPSKSSVAITAPLPIAKR